MVGTRYELSVIASEADVSGAAVAEFFDSFKFQQLPGPSAGHPIVGVERLGQLGLSRVTGCFVLAVERAASARVDLIFFKKREFFLALGGGMRRRIGNERHGST